jgi:hypothetical protein
LGVEEKTAGGKIEIEIVRKKMASWLKVVEAEKTSHSLTHTGYQKEAELNKTIKIQKFRKLQSC